MLLTDQLEDTNLRLQSSAEAEKHGGDMKNASAVKEGTAVTVTFPRRMMPAPPADASPSGAQVSAAA